MKQNSTYDSFYTQSINNTGITQENVTLNFQEKTRIYNGLGKCQIFNLG
jgi:hypothetical protein